MWLAVVLSLLVVIPGHVQSVLVGHQRIDDNNHKVTIYTRGTSRWCNQTAGQREAVRVHLHSTRGTPAAIQKPGWDIHTRLNERGDVVTIQWTQVHADIRPTYGPFADPDPDAVAKGQFGYAWGEFAIVIPEPDHKRFVANVTYFCFMAERHWPIFGDGAMSYWSVSPFEAVVIQLDRNEPGLMLFLCHMGGLFALISCCCGRPSDLKKDT